MGGLYGWIDARPIPLDIQIQRLKTFSRYAWCGFLLSREARALTPLSPPNTPPPHPDLHPTNNNAPTSMTNPDTEQQEALRLEIVTLEQKLSAAKLQLTSQSDNPGHNDAPYIHDTLVANSLHTLLLLSDSALPLGSFAFSSGLESYLAHHKAKSAPTAGPAVANPSQLAAFHTFLSLSLQSLASTALPYVLAAYRNPERIEELDNDFDASTICTVARRASVAQGRALLSVWERSFKGHHTSVTSNGHANGDVCGPTNLEQAISSLKSLSIALRSSKEAYPPNAHLAPLWGIITLILSIPLHSAAYLFLFSHARTVISAAVRASVLGPYQAQGVLASTSLRDSIEELVKRYWDRETEEAGQSVPAVDLWVGRHEMLYSRIFNS
jgi:urease accessory protein